MTEKRFRITQGYADRFCYDWQNNQLLNFRKTVELLNKLSEENGELKQKVDFYKDFQKDARELEKENEKLKQEFRLVIDELKRQNMKLKLRLKDLGVEYL